MSCETSDTLSSPKIKVFTLAEMQSLHKEQYPNLMFEFFMDHYCHRLLDTTYGLKKVQVIVSDTFKYEYRKSKLEAVR